MTIPLYPDSSMLSLAHEPAMTAAFSRWPPEISEYTFTNLFSWMPAYRFSVSQYKEAILLRSNPPEPDSAVWFPPIAEERSATETMVDVLNAGARFVRVPASLAQSVRNRGNFLITEDPNNADYVYETQALAELSGRRYDGKRNLIKKFSSQHHYEYTVFTAETIRDCLPFVDRWCEIKQCDLVEGLRYERRALSVMVEKFSEFGLRAGGIWIDARLCAVAMAQPLNPRTLVLHILKADGDRPGLYQTMLNEFVRRQAGPFSLINLEQDLGVPGLRTAKQSYHPCMMVQKFTIETPEIGGRP